MTEGESRELTPKSPLSRGQGLKGKEYMAIQFARCAYVSRSTGGNACRKASYNQRDAIRCERTGELFSFKDRGGNVHHEILLPDGVHDKFKNASVLWNEVERCEKRKDSQVAKEFVLALPDDAQVTFEDRLELTRQFAHSHFVEKGLGVQLDIHEPDEEEKNWHAHLLVSTRRFSTDGLSFEKTKARDLDPTIKKGFVVEADVWGEHWRDLQNAYFEEKGYDLRVDPIAIVPQEHLGPVRMRHHMNDAIARAQMLQKTNGELARDPGSVLEALTRNKAVFSQKDVDAFLRKHVGTEHRKQVAEGILGHATFAPLYDKNTGNTTGYFTTTEVRAEEEKLLRFAVSVGKRSTPVLSSEAIEKGMEGRAFSEEQHKAYELCVQSGQNLSLIQGRAGVGKSYVLNGIRMAHEEDGYRVIGLAPTNKIATDLRESGFKEAKTCHSFLFSLKNDRTKLDSNTLVVIDEAGMLGTELSVELFHAVKTSGAKLVLVGDDRQLSAIDRGGVFTTLLDHYDSVELKDVRRQTISWQKAVSEDLSRGDVKSAVQILQQHDRIDWKDTREEALTSLLKAWTEDGNSPLAQKHILAQKNIEVDALNLGARDILRQQGKLGDVELSCMTSRGKAAFAVGDRIQLTKTDKTQGLINQQLGMIEQIDETAKTLTVCFDNGEKKEIDPSTYNGLRHGYASTVYKAQGATLKHVHVLHSNTTNQATSYVSLTRQTKSVSLYVSQEETPSTEVLIHQMERQQTKGTSLVFDTLKDIEKQNAGRSFLSPVKEAAEVLVTKVKDKFHRNESFYRFEKEKSPVQEGAVISVPEKLDRDLTPTTVKESNPSSRKKAQEVLNQITRNCERLLYSHIAEKNIPLTTELKKRIPLQAKGAAHFIFYAHTLNGTTSTEKETKRFLARAKYELDRIPQIKEKLRDEWYKKGKFNETSSPFMIHMIAERQASIEGRLFLEAREAGQKPSPHIPQLAEIEFKNNKTHTKTFAQQLRVKYSLSEDAAKECARNILRYQETHGTKPTDTQRAAMAEIARQLVDKSISSSEKDSHTLIYLRRINGDAMFRERCYEAKDTITQEYNIIKMQEKALLETQKQPIEQEVTRHKELDFSMSM